MAVPDHFLGIYCGIDFLLLYADLDEENGVDAVDRTS